MPFMHMAVCRFLAEAPHLEEDRLRKLLEWLVTLQDGAAIPYLLQLLVQASGPESPPTSRQKWIDTARRTQVYSLPVMINYVTFRQDWHLQTLDSICKHYKVSFKTVA